MRVSEAQQGARPERGLPGCDGRRIPQAPFFQAEAGDAGPHGQDEACADHGETSYKGSGRLKGKRAVIITGADNGIGYAVAIACASEGADLLIVYLEEDEDARATKELVEAEGRKAVLVRGDIQDAGHCEAIIQKTVTELGGIDILVNNAAHQASLKQIEDNARGVGADLGAADPLDPTGGLCVKTQRAGTDEAAGPGRRSSRPRRRHVCRSALQLRVRRQSP